MIAVGDCERRVCANPFQSVGRRFERGEHGALCNSANLIWTTRALDNASDFARTNAVAHTQASETERL